MAAASGPRPDLARKALEAAIRNLDDLLALLPSTETSAAPAQRIYQSKLSRDRVEPSFQTCSEEVQRKNATEYEQRAP